MNIPLRENKSAVPTAKLVKTTVECATQEPILYGFNKYLQERKDSKANMSKSLNKANEILILKTLPFPQKSTTT